MLRSQEWEPENFTYREKWLLLARMIPLIEKQLQSMRAWAEKHGQIAFIQRNLAEQHPCFRGGQDTVANLF
jgi:ATP-dependent Lon protease